MSVDEAGWRVGGWPAWRHVRVGERSTCYAIDPRRGAGALERVVGWDWGGVLVHDGFAAYDRFTAATHQQGVAHLLRRARELPETATRGAVRFPRQVIALFTGAVRRGNEYLRGESSAAAVRAARADFEDRLLRLVAAERVVPAYETLAGPWWQHFDKGLTFLSAPGVEATNRWAEPAVRPAVVNRKVWGGNRTEAGAAAQGTLTSVLATSRQQGRSALDYVSQTLRAFGNALLSRPILLTTR